MIVVQVTTIYPNPGVKWKDVQKLPVSTVPRT
jgi:hypothetical protein